MWKNSNSNRSSSGSGTSIAGELALIQRQVGELTELVESKDQEIEELRGNIRSEKSTFITLNEKLNSIEQRVSISGSNSSNTSSNGERKKLVSFKNGPQDRNDSFEDDPVDDDDDEGSEEEIPMLAFDEDTFSMMMLAPVMSRDWLLAITAVSFQWVLLILINIDLHSDAATPLNIPYSVPMAVTAGQFLGIFICVGVQTDVLSSVRLIAALWRSDDWAETIGEEEASKRLFFVRIIMPNLMKFVSGCLVLTVNFVTIVQSDNIVDLMKDVAALLIISEITEIFFKLAEFGFLGKQLENNAKDVPETEVEDSFINLRCGVNARLLVFIILVVMMGSTVAFFIDGQRSGSYFKLQYPYCDISIEEIQKFGNEECDGFMNSIACDFDGGDCVNYNLAYPNCDAVEPSRIGDGTCDINYNTIECDYDGADCCPYSPDTAEVSIELSQRLNDGVCDGGQYSTQKCKYDEGDCDEFRKTYFDCELNELASLVDADNPPRLGDGICETSVYNNEACGFEYGDCIECNALVSDISNFELTGDGTCHGGAHNSAECNNDARDCEEFNRRYPRCAYDTRDQPHSAVPVIGDGICNSGLYNNPECGFEDGDCLLCNELIDNVTKLGDGVCDGQNYMSIVCGLDGGDCKDCQAPRFEIGNGWCTPEFNTPGCGYDGGDCLISQEYKGCDVPLPSLIGNGYCNGGVYDTEECGFDGGDCNTKNQTEALCKVPRSEALGDGKCNGYPYNTEECNFDNGDCEEFNKKYKGCNVQFPELVGNGWCSGGEYDTEACGWDGGDCG